MAGSGQGGEEGSSWSVLEGEVERDTPRKGGEGHDGCKVRMLRKDK